MPAEDPDGHVHLHVNSIDTVCSAGVSFGERSSLLHYSVCDDYKFKYVASTFSLQATRDKEFPRRIPVIIVSVMALISTSIGAANGRYTISVQVCVLG